MVGRARPTASALAAAEDEQQQDERHDGGRCTLQDRGAGGVEQVDRLGLGHVDLARAAGGRCLFGGRLGGGFLGRSSLFLGSRRGLSFDEREELIRLRRENKRLRQERDVLKKASIILGGGET